MGKVWKKVKIQKQNKVVVTSGRRRWNSLELHAGQQLIGWPTEKCSLAESMHAESMRCEWIFTLGTPSTDWRPSLIMAAIGCRSFQPPSATVR